MQNLKSLISTLPETKISGSGDPVVKGIAYDSRDVKPGYLFVAVKGGKADGHDFITDALKKGAVAIVGQKNINTGKKFIYIKVKDSREALGYIASNWYGNPSQKLKIIGVTGTKGKTTTVHIIYHILTHLGKKTGLVSSIAAKIGDREIDTGFHVTNPDAIALNKFLSEMVDKGLEYAVIEVSSHGIAQKRITGISFEAGVLTNIAPEHLDYHKTFSEYKKTKMSFINSSKIKIIAPKKTEIKILPGFFNNLNADAAVAAVTALGIDREKAVKALESFKLPEGRLEEIKNSFGVKIIIDFAHTPDSFEAALKHLRGITKGRLISVFGSAGERDPYKRPKMGAIAAKYSDEVILTAEDPRSESLSEITAQIRAGMPKVYKNVHEIGDRSEAIHFALRLLKKDDTVVLLGKGHEKSMNLDGKKEIPWSDRETVRKYIKEINL